MCQCVCVSSSLSELSHWRLASVCHPGPESTSSSWDYSKLRARAAQLKQRLLQVQLMRLQPPLRANLTTIRNLSFICQPRRKQLQAYLQRLQPNEDAVYRGPKPKVHCWVRTSNVEEQSCCMVTSKAALFLSVCVCVCVCVCVRMCEWDNNLFCTIIQIPVQGIDGKSKVYFYCKTKMLCFLYSRGEP